MVILVVHVVHVAFHYRCGEEGSGGDGVLLVEEAVTLLICLCADVQTILVAKVIEVRIVRIVTCADGVDVELLHELNVLHHALT